MTNPYEVKGYGCCEAERLSVFWRPTEEDIAAITETIREDHEPIPPMLDQALHEVVVLPEDQLERSSMFNERHLAVIDRYSTMHAEFGDVFQPTLEVYS